MNPSNLHRIGMNPRKSNCCCFAPPPHNRCCREPRTPQRTEAEIRRLQERDRTAQAYSKHPALLRMLELKALGELARNRNARIYLGFDKHAALDAKSCPDDPSPPTTT